MSETTDDPEALVALPPPDLVASPPPTPGELTHVGVPLRSVVGAKLALAMFLHHGTIGLWIVTLGSYIETNSGGRGTGMFTAGFVGVVYGAGPLGGLIAPFLSGMLADHFFSTEKMMAVLNVLSAAALYGAVVAESQAMFYLAILAFFLCFSPSFTLATSMTLHHLARPERDFPIVRACSTAGWVAAGLFVGWVWPQLTGEEIETTIVPLKLAIYAALVTAVYCLWLPHTPPSNRRTAKGVPRLKSADTFDLFRNRRFLLLLGLAALAHIPSQFYYAYANVYMNWMGMTSAAAKMSLGQVVEIVAMVSLPAVLLRVSVKASIAIGLAVWSLRFWMFAAAASPSAPARDVLIYVAILLHGIAFTLVTISLQLDVDRCAGRHRRATAQGLLSMAMQGVGSLLGAQLAGVAGARLLSPEASDVAIRGWQSFWSIPATVAAVVLAIMLLALPSDAK